MIIRCAASTTFSHGFRSHTFRRPAFIFTEASAILFWSEGCLLEECPAQSLLVAKAGQLRDFFERHVTAFEVLHRGFHAKRLHPSCGRQFELRFELTREGTWAHRDCVGECWHVEIT